MRWLQGLISVSLLSLGVFGAKESTEERFQSYHAKAAPVKLNDVSYKELTAVPRDYTGVVLLTALEPKFGCQLCRQFQPEWELLSRSWTKGDKKGDSRVLFGTLDFSDGRDTFVAVGSSCLLLTHGSGTLIASCTAGTPNRPRPPPLSAHHRSARYGLRRAASLRLHQWPADRRASARLDCPPYARPPTPGRQASLRLGEVVHHQHPSLRLHFLGLRRLALLPTHPTEPKCLGCHQSDCHPDVHQRPHVQPHPPCALHLDRRQGRY